jgi:hypothetical protein
MELYTTDETKSFIGGIFYRYGLSIIRRVCELYELNEEQEAALQTVLMNSGDWQIFVKEPLNQEK